TELSVNGTRSVQHFTLNKNLSVSRSRVATDSSFVTDLQTFSFAQGLPLHRECPEAGGVILFMKQSVRWHCVIPPLTSQVGILSLRKIPHHQCDQLKFEDPHGLMDHLSGWVA